MTGEGEEDGRGGWESRDLPHSCKHHTYIVDCEQIDKWKAAFVFPGKDGFRKRFTSETKFVRRSGQHDSAARNSTRPQKFPPS